MPHKPKAAKASETCESTTLKTIDGCEGHIVFLEQFVYCRKCFKGFALSFDGSTCFKTSATKHPGCARVGKFGVCEECDGEIGSNTTGYVAFGTVCSTPTESFPSTTP